MPDNHASFDFFGITLQVVRTMKGLSQAELAERAGIRANQLSRYETDQVLPQLPQLAKVLDALGIDFLDLALTMRLVAWLDEMLAEADPGRPLLALSQTVIADLYRLSLGEIDGVRRALREAVRGVPSCT